MMRSPIQTVLALLTAAAAGSLITLGILGLTSSDPTAMRAPLTIITGIVLTLGVAYATVARSKARTRR